MFPSSAGRAAGVSSLLFVGAVTLLSASASENAVNDGLLKLPPREQRAVLQDVVGDGCRVTRAFFSGVARKGIAKGRAFWSVACADGRTFMVMIPPNVDGTRVIECSKLKALGIGSCFKKLED